MRRLTSILALSLLLVTLAVPATAQAAPSTRYTTITASVGVSLGANVIEPTGPGPLGSTLAFSPAAESELGLPTR